MGFLSKPPSTSRARPAAAHDTARSGNEVRTAFARVLQFLGGYQTRVRITGGDGKVVEVPWGRRVGSDDAAAGFHPLQCVASATDELPRRVRVVLGSVGGLANAFSGGDSPATYVTAVNGEGFVFVRLTVSAGGSPTGMALDTAVSLPADSKTLAILSIASTAYTVEAGLSVGQIVSGSQDYNRCDDAWNAAAYKHQFRLI